MPEPESLLESLIAALQLQKEIVDRILGTGVSPKGEDLHDLRVALRRMASLARLSRGFPRDDGARSLRKAARNLRRELSQQRTLEISYLRLKRRFARDPVRRDASRLIAEQILPGGRHAVVESAERILGLKGKLDRRFAKRLGQLTRAIQLPGDRVHDETLRPLFQKRLEKMRQALLEFGIPEASDIHPFRIASKDLRYALEFLEGDSTPLRDLRKALKFFQDVAGDAHDRIELVTLVEGISAKSPARFGRPSELLLPKLEVDSARAVNRARRLSARLIAQLVRTPLELPVAP